jgi:transcriptional regulator with XRE-family HTH domain
MVSRTSLIDDYIGKKLRTARIIRNLSQDELAKKVGITFQQIQKYEKGLNRISASRLYWFMRILGVDFNFFFSGIDDIIMQDNHTASQFNESSQSSLEYPDIDWDSKETMNLLRSYYSVKNPEARNKILALIKVIED